MDITAHKNICVELCCSRDELLSLEGDLEQYVMSGKVSNEIDAFLKALLEVVAGATE